MSCSRSMWTSAKFVIQKGIRTSQKRTNSTVESRGSTAVDTVFSEGFNRANFDSFVASETREVIAGKFQDLLSRGDEFKPESICTRNDGHRGEIRLFFWGERDTQGFRCPFVNKLVDCLLDGIQRIGERTLAAEKSFQKNE